MTQIDRKAFTQLTNLNILDCFYIDGVPAPYQGSFASGVISGDYTTSGNQVLKLSSDVKITLNLSPVNGERVYIKSATGKGFNVISGKGMDGQTNIRYSTPYIMRIFDYSSDLDTWSIF